MGSLHPFSRTHWDHEPELRKPLEINETTFRFMERQVILFRNGGPSGNRLSDV